LRFNAGEPYLQKHRIRAGKQTVTLMVPQKPTRAGIDPRYLLDDLTETDDNIKGVKIEGARCNRNDGIDWRRAARRYAGGERHRNPIACAVL